MSHPKMALGPARIRLPVVRGRRTPTTGDDRRPYPRSSSVRHAEWGHGVVVSVEEDRVTVLFDAVGYKTLTLAAIEERDLLTLDVPGTVTAPND